jgi:hypothetical protein
MPKAWDFTPPNVSVLRISSMSVTKLVIILALVLVFFTSCRSPDFIYTEDGKIECGGNGQAIILTNNVTAVDPTFDELVAFIQADTTDTRKYVAAGPDAYVCADFAEEVHNNAEAAGIRAAWVSLSFEGTEEGHALNAFETSDQGLVYIDCTNSGNGRGSWDAIAYIETGQTYGVLPIERVLASQDDYYRFEYDFYAACEKAWREYEAKLKAYNDEVDRFNRESAGRVFIIGSPEAQRMMTWKESLLAAERELESLKAQAGGRWLESEYSSYLVKSVNIHW